MGCHKRHAGCMRERAGSSAASRSLFEKWGMIMRSLRFAVTLAALALLGGLTPASAQDKTLVSGDSPLTQEMVDNYQQRWEWYCDIKLTPGQRRQHRQHFVAFWKKAARSTKQWLVTGYAA